MIISLDTIFWLALFGALVTSLLVYRQSRKAGPKDSENCDKI